MMIKPFTIKRVDEVDGTAPAVVTMESLFRLPAELLDRPEAQRARVEGTLLAKQEAHKTAKGLVSVGGALKGLVLLVSFLHIWHLVSLIVPPYVAPMRLPDWLYHTSSGLFTATVDAVALYLVTSRQTLAYIGEKRQGNSVMFFYVLTALLNGVFILMFMPDLAQWFAGWLLTVSRVTVAIMLSILVPVSIAAIESAHQINEVARLMLIRDIKTLQGVLNPQPVVIGAQPTVTRQCKVCNEAKEVENVPSILGVFARLGCDDCRSSRKEAIPQ